MGMNDILEIVLAVGVAIGYGLYCVYRAIRKITANMRDQEEDRKRAEEHFEQILAHQKYRRRRSDAANDY
jgi:hypothetical protein